MDKNQREFLCQVAKGIAEQFGPQCEVVAHDLTQGYEGTIVTIENGHVTGRKIGDGASEIVLVALKDASKAEDHLNYQTRTPDGRILKSSSIYLRNDEGKPSALLSINYDVTEISQAVSVLSYFNGISQSMQNGHEVETIFTNVNDVLDNLIEESCTYVGKPVALMSKEDKVKAIHYLDQKGAFLIKKSGDKVSKFYDISKYTLYNYMDAE
jgi:predicted transcriptional regulator YheO